MPRNEPHSAREVKVSVRDALAGQPAVGRPEEAGALLPAASATTDDAAAFTAPERLVYYAANVMPRNARPDPQAVSTHDRLGHEVLAAKAIAAVWLTPADASAP